jgi:hypothetical protein
MIITLFLSLPNNPAMPIELKEGLWKAKPRRCLRASGGACDAMQRGKNTGSPFMSRLLPHRKPICPQREYPAPFAGIAIGGTSP